MILWTFPLVLLPLAQGRTDCSKKEYDKCVRIADPLVKETHLVFPDNVNDIDQVCNIWNLFVDCLKLYTDDCFTDQQRRQFNIAVKNPIESVHQMCSQPSYQKEYLQYAPCIKNTIVQRERCGPQYSLLVEQVEQGDVISKSTLCCSHDRFKHCVLKETRRLCDRGVSEGPATKFADQTIDKALSFLRDQCLNYIPNSGDCEIHTTDSQPFADRSDPISAAVSEASSWGTVQENLNKQSEMSSANEAIPKLPPYSWGSSPSNAITSTTQFPTQLLGSRTRPASYGRSSSWSDNNQDVAGNTVQMYSEVNPSQSSTHSWQTGPWDKRAPSTTNGILKNSETTYNPQWSQPETSSITWYSADPSNNEVDEPNQLGLTKPRNGSVRHMSFLSFLFFELATFVLYTIY